MFLERSSEVVYKKVRQRLLQFNETETEKQMRVRSEFQNLHKLAHMSCLEFEAKWEEKTTALYECGLGKMSRSCTISTWRRLDPGTVR